MSQRGRCGLTLIEVLVSITILAVVSVAIISAFGGLVALNRTAQADLGAGADARAVVEDVRQWASDRSVFDDLTQTTLGDHVAAIPEYGACQVDSVAEPIPNVKRVAMWCDVEGGSAPVQLLFDLARPRP